MSDFKDSGIEKNACVYPWSSPNMSGPGPVQGGIAPQSISIQQSVTVPIQTNAGLEPAGYSGPMDYKHGGPASSVPTTGSGLQGGTCIKSGE